MNRASRQRAAARPTFRPDMLAHVVVDVSPWTDLRGVIDACNAHPDVAAIKAQASGLATHQAVNGAVAGLYARTAYRLAAERAANS